MGYVGQEADRQYLRGRARESGRQVRQIPVSKDRFPVCVNWCCAVKDSRTETVRTQTQGEQPVWRWTGVIFRGQGLEETTAGERHRTVQVLSGMSHLKRQVGETGPGTRWRCCTCGKQRKCEGVRHRRERGVKQVCSW